MNYQESSFFKDNLIELKCFNLEILWGLAEKYCWCISLGFEKFVIWSETALKIFGVEPITKLRISNHKEVLLVLVNFGFVIFFQIIKFRKSQVKQKSICAFFSFF